MSESRDDDVWTSDELVDGVDEPAETLDDLEDDILAPDPMLDDEDPDRPPYGRNEPPS